MNVVHTYKQQKPADDLLLNERNRSISLMILGVAICKVPVPACFAGTASCWSAGARVRTSGRVSRRSPELCGTSRASIRCAMSASSRSRRPSYLSLYYYLYLSGDWLTGQLFRERTKLHRPMRGLRLPLHHCWYQQCSLCSFVCEKQYSFQAI